MTELYLSALENDIQLSPLEENYEEKLCPLLYIPSAEKEGEILFGLAVWH